MNKKIVIALMAVIFVIIGIAGVFLILRSDNNRTGSVPPVMIFEVYTAGGYFSGQFFAPYQNSYVVLYNSSEEAVSLDNWLLLACEPDGTVLEWQSAMLRGVIQPNSFFVIQGGSAYDAFERPVGEPLPFDVDLVVETFSPLRRHGIIVLYRSDSAPRSIRSDDRNIVDFLVYGNASFADAQGGESADSPSVRRILRRNSFENTRNNAADFRLLNIHDNPAHIIRFYSRMTSETLHALRDYERAVVSLSHGAGFFSEEFDLTITTTLGNGARIFYTLDGSAPITQTGRVSDTAIEYTEPIRIRDRTGEPSLLMHIPGTTCANNPPDFTWPPPPNENESEADYQNRLHEWFASVYKANVIRVAAVNENNAVTPTVSATFFVSEQSFAYRFNMPVISVITYADGLYHPETGIFMDANREDRGITVRVPATIQFFEKDGTMGFSESIRLQMHGGHTRRFPQKSLRVYFASNTFEYDLFGGYALDSQGQIITQINRFILHSGGNDWRNGGLRDTFSQRFFSQLGTFEYQASRPATVFINGEYWGTYFILERHDAHFINYRFGIPREDVAMSESFSAVRQGDYSDIAELRELRQFIIDNDMTIPANYQRFIDIMDKNSYIDYFICQIVSGNRDWPHTNIRLWKNRNPYASEYTKWRMIMVDLDQAFRPFNSLDNLLRHNETYNALMFSSLMENVYFKDRFVSRSEYLLETFFIPENMIQAYLYLHEEITPAFSEHSFRWGLRQSDFDRALSSVEYAIEYNVRVFAEETAQLRAVLDAQE